MKKFLILPLTCVFAVLFFGCSKKGCDPVSPAAEASQMLAYASSHGMTMAQHTSGMFYEILDPGTGPAAINTSTIYITYVGKMLNDSQFDIQTDPARTGWKLERLIEGWRLGIPLIKEGGHIRLLVPSSLAYGCEGKGTIPGNASLFFDITLVDVQ